MHLYVYYTVADHHAPAVRRQVEQLQQRVLRDYGVAGRVQQRAPAQPEQQTWMEIYPNVPGGFAAVIEQFAGAAGLPALIEGERHAECFTDLAPCA